MFRQKGNNSFQKFARIGCQILEILDDYNYCLND